MPLVDYESESDSDRSDLESPSQLDQVQTDLHNCVHAFIYLEYEPSKQVADLLHSYADGKPDRYSLVYSELGALQPLHISLSSTLMIHKSDFERFFKALQSAVATINIRPLTLSGKCISLPNPSRTRWFSGLLFAKPNVTDLQAAITTINKVLIDLQLGQPLQPSDYPHISIAQSNNQVKDETLDLGNVASLYFPTLNLRCGSRVFELSLGGLPNNRRDMQ